MFCQSLVFKAWLRPISVNFSGFAFGEVPDETLCALYNGPGMRLVVFRPKRRLTVRIEHHGIFSTRLRGCSTIAAPSIEPCFMTSSHHPTPDLSQRKIQTSKYSLVEMQQPPNGFPDQDPSSRQQGESTELQNICAGLHGRISGFLSCEVSDELLKQVQDQTRITLGVAEEAVAKYGYVS